MIDDAVLKPGSGPSTNSKDPFLYSLQEPESNTGLLQIMTAIDVQGTSVSDTALALWAENSSVLSHQPEAIQNTEVKTSETTTCR